MNPLGPADSGLERWRLALAALAIAVFIVLLGLVIAFGGRPVAEPGLDGHVERDEGPSSSVPLGRRSDRLPWEESGR